MRNTPIAENLSIESSPWLERLAESFARRPERLAYRILDSRGNLRDQISYEQLSRRVYALAAGLVERVEPHERVLLVYPDGIDFIVALLAVMFAGAVPVPLPYPKSRLAMERLVQCMHDCRATLALVSPDTQDKTRAWLLESGSHACLTEQALRHSSHCGAPSVTVAPSDLALLQYTSGSTGTPKGVMVSHANLFANERAMWRAFGHSDDIVVAGWLPLTHDMGLMGNALQPLFVGGQAVLCPPEAFIRRPRTWLEMFTNYGANTGGAPCFGYEFLTTRLEDTSLAGLDLSSWKVAYCGAEPVRSNSLRAFEKKFAAVGFSERAWFPCYGLAEATLFVSGVTRESGFATDVLDHAGLLERKVVRRLASDDGASRTLVRCGFPAAEHDLRIVDPDTGRECGPQQTGEVWIAGPSVARGYWNRPELSQETFCAVLAGSDRRYLRTGDIGFMSHGQLCVTGRLKDVLIINGKNRHAEDIEATVSECDPRLTGYPSAAFALTEQARELSVIVQEAPRSYGLEQLPALGRKVSAALLQMHGFTPDVLAFVPQGTLPRTTSGKIRRKESRRLYEQQALPITWSALV